MLFPVNRWVVSALLYVTGFLLFVPRLVKKGGGGVGCKSALIMGIGQAFAILPGISRSGSTIVAGMLSGAKAEKSRRVFLPHVNSGYQRWFCADNERSH